MHWVVKNFMADVVENRISKLFSIHLILHIFYRWIIIFSQNNHCFTNDANVLHQFECYLKHFSWINIFPSLHETGGLKLEFQSYVFDDVRNKFKLVSTQCTVTSNVYFQSCWLMFRGRICYIVKDNILILLTSEVPIWAKHSQARRNRQTNKNQYFKTMKHKVTSLLSLLFPTNREYLHKSQTTSSKSNCLLNRCTKGSDR